MPQGKVSTLCAKIAAAEGQARRICFIENEACLGRSDEGVPRLCIGLVGR